MSSSATGVGMTICFLGAILLILTQKSSQKFGDVLGIMSRGAEKKVAKKPLYQSTIVFTKTSFNHGNNQTERKNHLVQQRRHKHKDGFQEPYGQEFSRSGIYRLYPAYRNRQHGIFTRYHRALQGR